MIIKFLRGNTVVHTVENIDVELSLIPRVEDTVLIETKKAPALKGKVERVEWHYSMRDGLSIKIYLE